MPASPAHGARPINVYTTERTRLLLDLILRHRDLGSRSAAIAWLIEHEVDRIEREASPGCPADTQTSA